MRGETRLPLSLLNRQFNCDNKKLFDKLPDNSIDLILTDPPYKDYQSNRPVANPKVKAVEARLFDADYFARESYRVLKKGHHLYCFCDHITFPEVRAAIENAGFIYKNCLIWVKNNHGSGDLKGNWAPQHEFILFATKGKGVPLKGRRKSNVLLKRSSDGGINFYNKVSNYKFKHGTAKPVELLRSILQSSSGVGDVVLDPYGGSGSTAEACILEKRQYVLVEIDKEHYRTAEERIATALENIKYKSFIYKQATP
jgi:site-specific DNA-methyltransferase (adenine-specific)